MHFTVMSLVVLTCERVHIIMRFLLLLFLRHMCTVLFIHLLMPSLIGLLASVDVKQQKLIHSFIRSFISVHERQKEDEESLP